MASPIRVLHYVNQFFAGRGGEAQAGAKVVLERRVVGPGRLLEQRLGADARIIATVVGGDAYVAEEPDAARAAFLGILEAEAPDLVIAGPAFESGRYGVACIRMCNAAAELGIPAVAGLHHANPAVALRARGLCVAESGPSVRAMPEALARLAALGLKLARQVPLGPSADEGYVPTGRRERVLRDRPGHERALAMLVDKLAGRPFVTELAMVGLAPVEPAHPVADLAKARLALVTSGGLVPHGNPDRMPSRFSRRLYEYELPEPGFAPGEWESVHAGFHVAAINEDPNRVVPLDVARALAREGRIGSLSPRLYSLAGVGTPDLASLEIARELITSLRRDGVDGVLLVAT